MFNGETTDDLVHELYTWGPALVQDIRSRFSASAISPLLKGKMVARQKFTGFQVYVLSGVGLRPYGYSVRYNYVPAKTVILGALIIRAMARQYAAEGYAVELYDGYRKRGRANLLLLRRNGRLTVLIGRPTITLKAIRVIVGVLAETLDIDELIAVVLEADHDPLLLKAASFNDIPFTLTVLLPTQITRETFTPTEATRR